jgi:hypothetical protein
MIKTHGFAVSQGPIWHVRSSVPVRNGANLIF